MLMILELIQTIENDDEREVVERIFHQYYKYMMARAQSILNNHHDAEDAVMETFCRISENVKQFVHLEKTETAALVSIYTRNVAINLYNRKKKQREIFDMSGEIESCQACGDPMSGNPQALIVDDETVDIVYNALDRLEAKYRDAIVLKYYYHLKNVEIANILGLDVNTVNSHIFRAKSKLREILGEEGYERITYGKI